jgi:ABC-type polysaccharide/polyol phosphate export permease
MADFNPFHHMIEAVRGPLLHGPGGAHHVWVLLAMALVGWGVALALLGRCRHRVAYWL